MPQTFGGYPIIEPARVRQARVRFRREMIPQLDLANSLTVTSGMWPARGWLLMAASDYAKITDKYAVNLQLVIDDFKNGPLTFKNLSIVQARCVTTGVSNASNALFLVQVTDGRGVIFNPWFALGTTSQYNVPAPAYPGRYYSETTNNGTPWTWDGMCGDLWVQMFPFLGVYPGLPYTPEGTPESFVFPGQSCWESLCLILDNLGMTVAVDLTSTTPYTIVSSGADDAVFTAKQVRYLAGKEDDGAWIDTGSGRVPGTVSVLFHRRNQYYATEETLRLDDLQWSTEPGYRVIVNAPATFTGAQGTAFLWDDYAVRFDVDGVPLAADVVTAEAIANERTQQFFNKIYSGTSGYLSQTYTGALPFATGSQCDGVRWSQTEHQRLAWQTSIARGWTWDDVVFSREPIVGARDDG